MPDFAPKPLFSTSQIRRIEQRAIDESGVAAYELMQRAGLAAWRLLLQRWPQAQTIGIVCGPGNNGGDGYVLARLAADSGRQVRVVRLSGDSPRAEPARQAYDAWCANPCPSWVFGLDDELPQVDVWVDALFGLGLRREPDRVAADLIAAIDASRRPVLALDLPSGVDADSGHAIGAAVRADITLTFIASKLGLHTGAGRSHAGEVSVDALDLPAALIACEPPSAHLYGSHCLGGWLSPRPRNSHKGHFGHVLCVGGEHGYAGAIALCAESALRCGAGLVSVATRAEHVAPLLARRPECMVRAVADAGDLQPMIERSSVIAIGPGLGQADWAQALLHAAVASGELLVIDADALNLLARDSQHLRDAIVTPHPGEAARLLGSTVAELERDRYAAAQALAQRLRCVVVLKGAGTIIAAPERAPAVIDAGNPGMAVGGMGDVLTGAIAALRAQGWQEYDAAVCGALLHSSAADAAAREGGERGLLPTDLMPWLRRLANPESVS